MEINIYIWETHGQTQTSGTIGLISVQRRMANTKSHTHTHGDNQHYFTTAVLRLKV